MFHMNLHPQSLTQQIFFFFLMLLLNVHSAFIMRKILLETLVMNNLCYNLWSQSKSFVHIAYTTTHFWRLMSIFFNKHYLKRGTLLSVFFWTRKPWNRKGEFPEDKQGQNVGHEVWIIHNLTHSCGFSFYDKPAWADLAAWWQCIDAWSRPRNTKISILEPRSYCFFSLSLSLPFSWQ